MIDVLLLPKGPDGAGSWIANHVPTPAIRTDQGDGRPSEKLCLVVVLLPDGSPVFKTAGATWPPARTTPEIATVTVEEPVYELPGGERVSGEEIAAIIHLSRDSHSRGFWAPVRVYTWCSYSGRGWEKLPVNKSFATRMIAWLEEQDMPSWAADLRWGEIHAGYHGSAIWTGLLHNALAMGAGLALFCSLGWIPARLGRLRAPAPGPHGRCGYCLAPRNQPGECAVCGEPTFRRP